MAERPLSPEEIGSFFARQYYIELKRQPETVHQFYKNSSTMVRVDGDTIVSAHSLLEIQTTIASLNFIDTEIRTGLSLVSMGGGVTVLLAGYVTMSNYNGRRKFMQSFFLAPQEVGYYVLSDIFHFLDEEFTPQLLENGSESGTVLSNSPLETQVSDSGSDDEATDFVPSGQLGDDYGFDEQHSVAHESPVVHEGEHHRQSLHNDVINEVCEGEPQKKTYASILRATKGQPEASTSGQSAPLVVQQLQVEEPDEAIEYYSGQEDDGELKSVFVSNLPFGVTAAPLEQELKQFGAIKPDGITIRSGPNNSYAFVYFESMAAVHAALQASPIELDGRQIYLKERRATASSEPNTSCEVKSIFVGNLPFGVTAARLEQELKQFGTIEPDGISIESGRNNSYAFVFFESMAAVHAALQASPIELDGWQIHLKERRAKALSEPNAFFERKSVFVKNLPYSVTTARLEREFKQFGPIQTDGIIIRREPVIGVCYAFVFFESTDAVHAALQASSMELDGNIIHIEERKARASGASPGRTRGGRGRGSSWSDGQRGGASGRGSKSRRE